MRTATRSCRRRSWIAAAIAVAALALPASAAAHIQVLPATVAPDDAVLFEVLVPNERSQSTTEVEMQVPAGVIPFSYEEPAGWRRALTKNKDSSTRTVIWRGRLRSDGFARFSLLASTPSQEGPITWKAIQTYSDGEKARWIGPAGSESPAAVTTVGRRFPKQNAGGESAEGQPAAATTQTGGDDDGEDEDEGSDDAALWLAIAALAVSLVTLALVLLRRRGSSAT